MAQAEFCYQNIGDNLKMKLFVCITGAHWLPPNSLIY